MYKDLVAIDSWCESFSEQSAGIQNVKSKILQVSKMSRVNLQKCQISYWLSWDFSAENYRLMSNFKLREHNLKG